MTLRGWLFRTQFGRPWVWIGPRGKMGLVVDAAAVFNRFAGELVIREKWRGRHGKKNRRSKTTNTTEREKGKKKKKEKNQKGRQVGPHQKRKKRMNKEIGNGPAHTKGDRRQHRHRKENAPRADLANQQQQKKKCEERATKTAQQ